MYKSPFLTEISNFMFVRNYSKRTVESYVFWIKRFIQFNENKHPKDLGSQDVEKFLTHLAVNRTVSMADLLYGSGSGLRRIELMRLSVI